MSSNFIISAHFCLLCMCEAQYTLALSFQATDTDIQQQGPISKVFGNKFDQ